MIDPRVVLDMNVSTSAAIVRSQELANQPVVRIDDNVARLFGNYVAMRTKIDEYGRLVIPKNIRDNLGLEADSPVDIEQEGEEMVIRPAAEGGLVRKNGVLIYKGGTVEEDVVEETRQARRASHHLNEVLEQASED